MTRMRFGLVVGPALAGAVLLDAGAGWAQQRATDVVDELVDELVACVGLQAEDERLACYDAIAKPLAGLSSEAEGEADQMLFSFAGTGDVDSEVFEVTEPWRAVWQSEASILTIELRSAQNEILDTIGFQIGSGGGRSDVQSPGVYRLAARGSGAWRVNVVPAE